MEALGKIGSERAVEPLIEVLMNKDEDEYVLRNDAAEALGNIVSEKNVDLLIEVLKDEDEDVRSSAVEVLGKIGNKKALAQLVERFINEDANCHFYVSKAFHLISTRLGIPVLTTKKS